MKKLMVFVAVVFVLTDFSFAKHRGFCPSSRYKPHSGTEATVKKYCCSLGYREDCGNGGSGGGGNSCQSDADCNGGICCGINPLTPPSALNNGQCQGVGVVCPKSRGGGASVGSQKVRAKLDLGQLLRRSLSGSFQLMPVAQNSSLPCHPLSSNSGNCPAPPPRMHYCGSIPWAGICGQLVSNGDPWCP